MASRLQKTTESALAETSPADVGSTARIGAVGSKNSLRPWQFWLAVTTICLIGLALRLPMITKSLWLDEAYTAWFTAMPFHKLWAEVPVYELHPPLYNIVLKAWTALSGRTEAGLRSLSVAASLGTILLLALSGKALRAGDFGDRVGLLAALLLAVNAGNINFAQQARPYALETLTAAVAVLSALVLLRGLQRLPLKHPSEIRRLWPAMLGLAVGAGLTMWLHDTGVFIPYGIWIALTVALLGFVPGKRWPQALAVALPGIGALLIWSPFIALFLHQSSHLASVAFWVKFSPQDLLSAWYLAAGGNYPVVIVMVFALLGLGVVWRSERPCAVMLAILLVLPLATVLAISYFLKPFYIDRLFEWMAPIVLGLAALGLLTALRGTMIRRVAIGAALIFSLMSTYSYYRTPTEDWRELIGTVLAEAKPGDIIIASPNDLDVPFDYYAPDAAKRSDMLFVPTPYPAMETVNGITTMIGTPMIVPADQAIVRAAIANRPRVWLIERRADFYDPDELIWKEISSTRKVQQTFRNEGIYVSLFQ